MRMIVDFFFSEGEEEVQKLMYLRQLPKCNHDWPLCLKALIFTFTLS